MFSFFKKKKKPEPIVLRPVKKGAKTIYVNSRTEPTQELDLYMHRLTFDVEQTTIGMNTRTRIISVSGDIGDINKFLRDHGIGWW